jgi:hypothetical protein
MASGAALGPNADSSKRKVYFIVNHEDALGIETKVAARPPDGLTAQIHKSLRLHQDHRLSQDGPPANP